jgi:hypothetical protein
MFHAVLRAPWSEPELEQLLQLMNSLERVGVGVEMELGLTDEFDPWAILVRTRCGTVFAHIARVDGRYVLDLHQPSRPVGAIHLDDLLARVLQHALRK